MLMAAKNRSILTAYGFQNEKVQCIYVCSGAFMVWLLFQGNYEPGKRHWLKVKKDYLNEGAMADTADLVVLGAFYGKGSNGQNRQSNPNGFTQ